MKEIALGIWIPFSLIVLLAAMLMRDEMITIFCSLYFICSIGIFVLAVV